MDRLFYGFVCAVWAMTPIGCGPEEEITTCPAALSPGDLVITEVMANPGGDDVRREWFELYNATDAAMDLAGVTVMSSRQDGSDASTHIMDSLSLGPGQYAVLGSALPEVVPPFMDYAYGDDLLLRNDAGRVAVKCDVVEVDAVVYTNMVDGVSQGLSSDLTPDRLANDDLGNWCSAVTEYSPGNLGTPGAGNDCTAGQVGGMCNDGDAPRPVVPAQAGDLIITEVMANPDAVDDASGEWFEVYVTGDVDLNGVGLGRDSTAGADTTLNSPDCLAAAAGSYLVIARTGDAAVNGGLPAADHEFGFSLVNSNGRLFINNGAEILDEVTWATADAGASLNLDPNFFDVSNNDDPAYWCPSSDNSYGDGDLGTPGGANQDCQIITPGFCNDDGVMREVVSPGPGEVTITEHMANPDVVPDSDGEWFEVRFDADVDLNGLQLGKEEGTVLTTVASPDCLRVTSGTYAVFARNNDETQNGGLPRVDAEIGFGLVNGGDRLFVAVGGTELDSVTYPGSTAGASASLDEDNGEWCDNTTDAYGTGDNTGTPGAMNPPCPQ